MTTERHRRTPKWALTVSAKAQAEREIDVESFGRAGKLPRNRRFSFECPRWSTIHPRADEGLSHQRSSPSVAVNGYLRHQSTLSTIHSKGSVPGGRGRSSFQFSRCLGNR